MSVAIFKEIKDAIKTRSPDLLIFRGVDPKDFEHVMEGLRHPTNHLEQYSFRIHWFAADKILKVVMPSKLHDANWTTKAEFPSVVLESGWSEPIDQLRRDAKLWQQGSRGKVRVVIEVKFLPRTGNRIGARLWINWANPHRGSTQILPAGNDPDGSPTIDFEEFFAGNCPSGIDPEGSIVLDLEMLRVLAREEILAFGRLHDDFQITSAKFSPESSVQESTLGNHYPSLLPKGWLDSSEGQVGEQTTWTCCTVGTKKGGGRLSGRSLTTEAEGVEFRDGSSTSECESGVDDHEESVANLSDGDEILEDLAKLGSVPEIISLNTPNEHNLTTSSTSDKDSMANPVDTITDPELVQSVKLVAGGEQSKSNTVKQKRLVDQLHSALVNAPDSWLPAQRKVTVPSAAEPTPATELEVTVSVILKAFNIASEEPSTGLEDLKTDHLSVVEVLKCSAALGLGFELISPARDRGGTHENGIQEALPLERRRMRNEEDVSKREGKSTGERVSWRHEESNVTTRIKVSGSTMEHEKFESRGNVEADDLFNGDQRQAMQRLLLDAEKELKGIDPARG
ncbi:hypothetical protein HOY80DRAFT_1038162 [Tuber brumale]|nr:hypothetical protein HOY80DRAFT_1038162 [Tuber brumale]